MAKKISTKKIHNNIDFEQPLYAQVHNVTIIADKIDAEYGEVFEPETRKPRYDIIPAHYVLTSHEGRMPAFCTRKYDTIEELAAAMKTIADLRTWRQLEIEA